MTFTHKLSKRLAINWPAALVFLAPAILAWDPDDQPLVPEPARFAMTSQPSTVTDLGVTATTDTSATLAFTEVDDGTGQPASYFVRFAPSPISWGSGTDVAQGSCKVPMAGTSIGVKQSCTVLGLNRGTAYEFQLVAFRGTLNLDAVFGGLSNLARGTTAQQVPAASVTVSPASASIPVGGTQQFTVTLKDANGNTLTGRTGSWASRDTGVATVSSTGLVTAKATGSATITATSEGVTGTAAVSVTATRPGTVTDLVLADVTESSATLSFTEVNDGTGKPASYFVRFGVAPLVWGSASDVTQGTCKVPMAGSTVGTKRSCTVLGLSAGTTYEFQLVTFRGTLNVDAVFGGLSNLARSTTGAGTAVPVASVTVTPASLSLLVGGVQQLSAVARDSAGNPLTGRAVSWSSSTPAIASVSSSGLVTGLAAGSATITATSEGKSGMGVATVQPAPASDVACPAYDPPAAPAPLRTFYVDGDNGNDAANGLSPQTPWRTLAKANSSAQPGDLFLLRGTFNNENLRPAVSGTSTAKIVYRAAAGQPNPAKMVGGVFDAAVWLDGLSHVAVEGLEISNVPDPVLIRYGASNVWIRRAYIHDAGGLKISRASDNRVEDSRFERIGSEAANTGDAIFIQDGANRNVIARNTVGPAGHGTIWVSFQGAGEATADNNIIAHNTTFNPWASGMGLNGKATRTIVECNKIFDATEGPVNYPRSGIELEGSGNIIRFNEIYSNGVFGITIQGRTFNGFTQNAIGNHIHNNTVFSNGNASLQIVQKDAGVVQNNIIENNIFWLDGGFASEGQVYALPVDLYNANSGNVWAPGQIGGNIVRNNIFPANQLLVLMIRTAAAGGNTSYSLVQAQTALAGWELNLQANPLFMNPAVQDFRLQAGSPAIDAGRPIGGYTFRGTAPDLGAWER